MKNATLRGKPDAGNPHVRFDEVEVTSAKSRRGSLLYGRCINSHIASSISVSVLLVVLLFVKSVNLVENPQFWAEDGKIFFTQARECGFMSLFMPYAGYFHFGTRLLALFASFFDGEFAPLIYFWMAFCVQLLVMLCVFFSPLFAKIPAKLFAAISLVCIPLGSETFFTVTNLHWHLAVLIPILSVGGPHCNFDRMWWVRVLSIIALGLTDPCIAVFFPLFLVRVVRHRHYLPECLLAAVAFMCVLAQGFSVLLSPSPVNLATTIQCQMSPMEVVRGYLAHPVRYVLGFFFFPWKCYLNRDSLSLPILITGCVLGVVLFGGVLAVALSQFRRIWNQLIFCGYVILSMLAAGIMRGPLAYSADRYYFVPFVYTSFALIIMAFPLHSRLDNKGYLWKCVSARVLLGVYLFVSMTIFVLPKTEDLHWCAEYKKALCDPQHEIPIHPTDNPIWRVRILQ